MMRGQESHYVIRTVSLEPNRNSGAYDVCIIKLLAKRIKLERDRGWGRVGEWFFFVPFVWAEEADLFAVMIRCGAERNLS